MNWIRNYHRRNPNISICELYGKLRQEKGYGRHPGSLYRVFVRLGYRKKIESTKKKAKHLGHYDTPTELGQKWQMDVKYVPTVCYVGSAGRTRWTFCAAGFISTTRRSALRLHGITAKWNAVTETTKSGFTIF